MGEELFVETGFFEGKLGGAFMQVEGTALGAGMSVCVELEDGAGEGTVLEEAREEKTRWAAWRSIWLDDW